MNLKKKSVRVLKNLQLKNGGILASPLSGAYPYIYTRDAVIATKALNKVGLVKNSEKFYYFMKNFARLEDYKEVFQRYTFNGLPSVTRKNENDNEGLLLHGIYDVFLHNQKETFIENMWPLIEETVKLIFNYSKSGLLKTEKSIHEFEKLEKGYEIWANCAGVRGLRDAAEIAKILGHKDKFEKWNSKADEVEKNIKKKMYNKRIGVFMKNTRFPNTPDMSQLAPFYFEINKDKKILKRTMDFLFKHLWDKELGGFRRFRKFEICEDWHWYTGGSGSWFWLTCWAGKFYKQLGDKKKYNLCLSWIKEISKKTKGFFPEHIATKDEYDDWKRHEIEFNTRIVNEMKKTEKTIKKFRDRKVVFWATPLCWSHAEYVLMGGK